MLAGLALMAGCASAPMHYYTLITPAPIPPALATPAADAPAVRPAGPAFELMPVSIPAQDDLPQLVIRQGGQGVALLQSERWIAPLADEIRGALSADLSHALGSPDVTGLAGDSRKAVRIKVDVRRFDSEPGQRALLDAAWSLRLREADAQAPTLACTSRISEPVGAGYAALVQGHQQALARLAGQIAEASRALADGTARCPAG
ncbi:PqiC family protein [Dyella sp.]|uniref:PqiC family protein n=1 Tax=Dyella sp. TaxID=1869338 RepID=UPI002D78BC24|nr:PqiC family protein [Dyella sp.]HET6433710.1 PqiC family protein [Dyella sp.]